MLATLSQASHTVVVMPRPLRIEFAGAWHHVMNRGADHQDIFRDDQDRWSMLQRLGAVVDECGIEVHAYCLMSNHFHLLVRTPEPNLGLAMKLFAGGYSQAFNSRHHIDGPLFRGRYRSEVVDSDSYLLGVSRYIHRNPVVAGLAKTAGCYQWSSYRAFIGRSPRPTWLRVTETLEATTGGIPAYARFVENELHQDPVADFYSQKQRPPVLGGPMFASSLGNDAEQNGGQAL